MSGQQEQEQQSAAQPSEPPEAEAQPAAPGSVTLSYADYEELRTLARERDEYLRRLQRAVADYQNLQKRVEKFLESVRETLLRSFAQEIVPVADGLTLALEAAERTEGAQGIVEGLRLVEKGFYGALAEFGIRPVEAVGRPFDPHYHEAALQEPAEGVASNTVIRETRRGFVMGDVVIRPSQVVVAKAAAPTDLAALSNGPEGEAVAGRDGEPG